MTVRELINQLLDQPKEAEVGICIEKWVGNDQVWIVAGKESVHLYMDEHKLMGQRVQPAGIQKDDSIMWVQGRIEGERIVGGIATTEGKIDDQ